jgi:hypothetical protein
VEFEKRSGFFPKINLSQWIFALFSAEARRFSFCPNWFWKNCCLPYSRLTRIGRSEGRRIPRRRRFSNARAGKAGLFPKKPIELN